MPKNNNIRRETLNLFLVKTFYRLGRV